VADYGRLLITKIIAENDLVPALTAGVRSSWFDDEEHAEVYAWMQEYFSRYGKAPTRRVLLQEFPAYRLGGDVPEPYEYYLDYFRRQRKRAIIQDTLIEADQSLQDDTPEAAEARLSQGLLRSATEVTTLEDTDATEGVWDRFREHQRGRNRIGSLTGIPTGFPTLDKITGGFQPQQFIVIGGVAKAGKSFLLMKAACAAQAFHKKVLFLSFEMSTHEQRCRYEALQCGVNAVNLMRSVSTPEELRKLRQGFRRIKDMAPFIISADISASTTMSGLGAKIEQHAPDIVFIDGVYLMDSESGYDMQSPQHYTAISRGLKRLAQRTGKPLVCVTQALSSKMGREGHVTMHSLAWSSAWSQDADLILGVEALDDSGNQLLNFRVVAGRNVSPRVMTLKADWNESTFEEANEGEFDDEDILHG